MSPNQLLDNGTSSPLTLALLKLLLEKINRCTESICICEQKTFTVESAFDPGEFLSSIHQFLSVKMKFDDQQSFYDVFDLYDQLGEGSFGSVMLCQHKTSGQRMAAKFVTTINHLQHKAVKNEIEVLGRLRHIRIAQLLAVYSDLTNEHVLVMELLEGGELLNRILHQNWTFNEKQSVGYVRQLCEGVAYIHKMRIIHLDIKPENILCTNPTGRRIKIIDFGVARVFDGTKEVRALAGTAEYSAPEVINYEPIDFSSDMWSIGVVTFLLLSGRSPFLGESDCETYSNVVRCQWNFDGEISTSARSFLTSLLVHDKQQRLTASECLAHEWLRPYSMKNRLKLFSLRKKLRKSLQMLSTLETTCYPPIQLPQQPTSIEIL